MTRSKIRAAWLLAASLATGVGSAGDLSASSSEAVARRVFDSFNRHDLDAMAALYAADAVIISPDQPGPLQGPAGIRTAHAPLFAQFPDIHDRIVSVTAQGDRVAVEFVSTGCEAPGKACFALSIASFLTVQNGLIVRDATYFDVPSDAQGHAPAGSN